VLRKNALIRTMDAAAPTLDRLAIRGETVAVADTSTEGIDLGGCCVVPRFTDSHVHFPTWP